MLSLDPELKPLFEAFPSGASHARGDWQNRRQGLHDAPFLGHFLPEIQGVITEDFEVASADGTIIPLRWYKAEGSQSNAAILYTHGGGKIMGSVEMYDPLCKLYAARADVGILAVDFRLAPEHPFPAPVEDCYAGLVWLADHAEQLNVDLGRIGVAGDSGGGGIAAGVALMARDRDGPQLARQYLIYPMLDDRNTIEDPALAPFATWSYDDNYTGWQCWLGDAIGSEDVSPHAAPSRAQDLSNLPTTFIDVGELDIFRGESIDYAHRLVDAGVSVEFHLYPGAPHGYDVIGFNTNMGMNAWQARLRAMSLLNA